METNPLHNPYSAEKPIHLPSEELLFKHAPLRPVDGCENLMVHQAFNFFSLWQAWEEESGGVREIPFWATVWPGAVVLASHLLTGRINVRGLGVLDLGCGSGAVGIAAARAGARVVVANDLDPVALYLTERNAEANQVHLNPETRDLLTLKTLEGVDVLLVSDLFYTKDEAGRMLDFLHRVRSRGTLVLIADGQRMFAPKTRVEVLAVETVPVDRELEGTVNRRVQLLKLVE
jgi:predicted nicotinamide N-methyase